MAGRAGALSPAAQMREHLAKMREKGLPFSLAWKRGLERMRWPEEKTARDEWKRQLELDMNVWEAAYERRDLAARGLSKLTNLFATEPSERFPAELIA